MTSQNDGGAADEMVPKAALDEERTKRETAEQGYAAMVEETLKAVPEHLKALIPADLEPSAKLKWFTAARKTGVFDRPKVPQTDAGKPAPIAPREPDLSKLSPVARMAAGYKK